MTMLIGRIEKHGRWWVALCEIVGAFTQGRSRREAMDNLAEVVELRVDRPRFKATVTELEPIRRDVFTVLVEPSEPAWLAAAVLRYQRTRRGLSLADVAKSLGAASRNAYASYEQGQREPTLGKFRELLRAVAPEMALVLEPRASAAMRRVPTRTRKPGKAAA
jgi:predicted RNase H-like HicB family nuclease